MICLLQVWLLHACQTGPGPHAAQTPSAVAAHASAAPTTSALSRAAAPASAIPVITTELPATPDLLSPIPTAAESLTDLPGTPDSSSRTGYLLPDSEVVYSPSALDFNTQIFLYSTYGYLGGHREYLRTTGWTSAPDIVQRVALESSINPRLLLALIEYQTGIVRGFPDPGFQTDYLMGRQDYHRKGLYGQLSWASSQLSAGYYGWQDGTLDDIRLADGIIVRPSPDLNPGSVALQFYLAQVLERERWQMAVEGTFAGLYNDMFGDSWQRSQAVEPLIPQNLQQPELILPFETNTVWSLTSGPHPAWEVDGAQAALDFAPSTGISGCVETDAWVLAVADGLVVRSEFGAVVQDLSGDGNEQTGWSILYMHIHSEGRAALGTYLNAGDRVGHPSCEGGRANGTHLHIARKYNGEWVAAGGLLPFVMSGWTAHSGRNPYEGSLTRGKRTVYASPYGSAISQLTRSDSDE